MNERSEIIENIFRKSYSSRLLKLELEPWQRRYIKMREEFQEIINFIKIADGIAEQKKIQNMVYILKQKGMNFKEPFTYHHFGPYSSELQIELNALVEWGILNGRESGMTYHYSIPENNKIESKDDETYKDLIQYLNKQSPQVLELVSTLYYLKNKGYESFKDIQQKTLSLKSHLAKEMKNALNVYEHLELTNAISPE